MFSAKIENMEYANIEAPYADIYENDLHNALLYLVEKRLTDREKFCIKEYFLSYPKCTYRKLAKKQHVSVERVRQITFKALRKLRSPLNRIANELYDIYYPECDSLIDEYINTIKNKTQNTSLDDQEEIRSGCLNFLRALNVKKSEEQLLQEHTQNLINESNQKAFEDYLNKYTHLKKFDWKSVNNYPYPFPSNSNLLLFMPNTKNLLYSYKHILPNTYRWCEWK